MMLPDAAPLAARPLFSLLAPWLQQLPEGPATHALPSVLAGGPPLPTGNGAPLHFIPEPADGLGYEERAWLTGAVATRPDNWHDYFNALIWLAFPATKAALNRRHYHALSARRAAGLDGRGAVRDALTLFDESGVVVTSSDPALLDLLTAFQWKALFVERRAAVQAHMRFFVFGHALYEQLLRPFVGITGFAMLETVAEDFAAQPESRQLALLDQRLAARWDGPGLTDPQDLQPLPLLGIPGVTPDNAAPAYYDDTRQFRPGRRSRRQPAAVAG